MERATSTALGYTLTLAISTLLVTGLVLSGSTFVETQRELVIRNELEVIGEQVAGQLEQADRLVSAGVTPDNVRINQTIPDKVAGKSYDVVLEEGSPESTLELTTDNPDVSVSLDIPLSTPPPTGSRTSAEGGIIIVQCVNPPPCTNLEVTDV